MLITKDFLQQADMTKAYMKGIGGVLASAKDVDDVSTTFAALTDLYKHLSVAVDSLLSGDDCNFSEVMGYLLDDLLWQELASCLASVPSGAELQVCKIQGLHLIFKCSDAICAYLNLSHGN